MLRSGIAPALVVCLLVLACTNYYKVQTETRPERKEFVIDSLRKFDRYFILRKNTEAFAMKNLRLSEDRKTIFFVPDTLGAEHLKHYDNAGTTRRNYNKSSPHRVVVSEVHLFSGAVSPVVYGVEQSISVDSLLRVEILEHDKARTTTSYVVGAAVGVVAAFAITALIIAATKSSCPFVYGYDGNDYVLQGEIYGGAIYPQLKRDDYLPLKLGPNAAGNYELVISNELKEVQYTDMAELWVVDHEPGEKIIPDETGNLYNCREFVPPILAKDNSGNNLVSLLAGENDARYYAFDDSTAADGTSTAILKFSNIASKPARLILRVKNSYFLDYLYGELAAGLGAYYPTYVKKQEKRSTAELKKWTEEQYIPLQVYQKVKGQWKKISSLTTVGPLEYRDIAVPLEVSGENDVEIALKTGFMFWELDAAYLDQTNQKQLDIQKISPLLAIDDQGRDVQQLLKEADNKFLIQPEIGNRTRISFSIPASTAGARSFILHANGYYRHVRSFNGKPKIAFLRQFRNPGAMALYGIKRFGQVSSEEMNRITRN